MNLTGLVAVSGKPGLYKLIGQNKSGFILESLDAQKSKLVVNMSTAKLASLEDITIYGEDEDLRLKDVFEAMKAFKGAVPEAKADGKDLRKFFFEVAPNHDETRVYASDIKKIVSWFHILKDLPIFSEEEQAVAEVQEVEVVEEEKPKATKAKEAKPKAEKAAKAPAKKATKKEA
ncbi:DUF5606 family protein [Pedobacter puniceum]|uniref:DUF5606 domain-containing protein n=1 Tax=Pedobacter puniceum TaxID=2666136 RepID=A0A7K0FSQ7_9SPHI|nr:DUF5606 domain-containing protein [Pedobacter puniceum]MRX48117.1 hypothetical protein [Pedobacter puniceum]